MKTTQAVTTVTTGTTGTTEKREAIGEPVPDTITYRPSEKEKQILARLKARYGASWGRLAGITVLRMGEAEGIATEEPRHA